MTLQNFVTLLELYNISRSMLCHDITYMPHYISGIALYYVRKITLHWQNCVMLVELCVKELCYWNSIALMDIHYLSRIPLHHICDIMLLKENYVTLC